MTVLHVVKDGKVSLSVDEEGIKIEFYETMEGTDPEVTIRFTLESFLEFLTLGTKVVTALSQLHYTWGNCEDQGKEKWN